MTAVGLDPERVAHFRLRVLAEALSEATADYWNTRAQRFLEGAHRPGVDYPGRRTAEDLDAHNQRVFAKAQACWNRATLEGPGLAVPPLVVAELMEATSWA